jgi:hypothetical protein
MKVLADREVQAQLGLLKSTLIQLDSTFNERDYGSSSFRAFVQKLADAQLVNLRQQGNSYVVEPLDREPVTEAPVTDEPAAAEAGEGEAAPESTDENGEAHADGGEIGELAAEAEPRPYTPYAPPAPVATRPPEEAMELLQQVLTPLRGTNPRPLYLRNVKQLLRAAAPSFDEQQHGFASLVDLLRAGQSQNWLRLQRDRRGALRVFIPPSGNAPAAAPEAAPVAVLDDAQRDALAAAQANRAEPDAAPVPPVGGEDEDRQPSFAEEAPAQALAVAAPPAAGEPDPEDSQIAILGYYDGIHGEKTDEAELSLAAAVADGGGRKKRGPRKPKAEGNTPSRRRKSGPKR